MSNKRVCIISANCQGAYINALLKMHPDFSKDFSIYYFVNYKKEVVPQELLRKADIIIYQPLRFHHKELSEEYILSYLNPKAMRIRILNLTFSIYWPFSTNDPRNINSVYYPFGKFPYGDKIVIELLMAGKNTSEILRTLKDKNFILSKFNKEEVIKGYIDKMRDIEQRRDIKLLDFILDNYKDYRLFVTPKHPAELLMVYQVNLILEKIGYKKLFDERAYKNLSYINRQQLPIHPYTAEALELKFDASFETKYNIFGVPLTWEEYYEAYIDFNISSIGFVQPEPKYNLRRELKGKISVLKENNRKLKDKKLVYLIYTDMKSALELTHALISELYGPPLQDVGLYFYSNTAKLIRDYYRKIRKLIPGRIHYDIIRQLYQNAMIYVIVQDPIKRFINDYYYLKNNGLTELSLEDFILSEDAKRNSNLLTKLLGRQIDILKLWRDYVNGYFKSPDEYFLAIESLLDKDATDEDYERAMERCNEIDIYLMEKSQELPFIGKVKLDYKSYEDSCPVELLDAIRNKNSYDLRLYKEVAKWQG